MTAPMVLDGAMNGRAVLAYVEQILVPTLAPGDIVVMDNLSSHKSERVKHTPASFGATALHLPPYSPDLNPIEVMFGHLNVWQGIETCYDRCAHIFMSDIVITAAVIFWLK